MVKSRENRVPIMMSDEELEMVDDWRFKNRVATRSDALRKLAAIAVALDGSVDSMTQELRRLWNIRELGEASLAEELGGTPNWEKVAAKAVGTLAEMIEPQVTLSEKLIAVLHQVALLKAAKDIGAALKEIEAAKMRSQNQISSLKKAFDGEEPK